MIDKDASLTPVDKFNYLLSVLTKEAKTLVESIEVTVSNYEVAWKMLQERFENKKIIARTLMDGFLDAEPIRRESYDSLVTLIDSYERNLLQLKKLDLDTDGWSHILAHLLYKRLDTETQRYWERHHKSREVPQYQNLLKFLRDHLATLQPIAAAKTREQTIRNDTRRLSTKQKYGSTLTTTATQNKSCPLCQKPYHSPFKCESFAKLNPVQRHEMVKKTGLCLNCLSFSHMVKACPSSACRVCGQKHHTMLHRRSTDSNSNRGQEIASSQYVPITTTPRPLHSSNAPIISNTPHSQSQTFATSPVPPIVSQSLPVGAHAPNAVRENTSSCGNVVFLSTAIIKIADSHGNIHLARALLDSCSERN
ncbi:uncharacterized protein LOC129767557 [Toxorhynchites rutilus septentrionalis]|uniref:uncharacterized protein LOC129767557 n=1 Tax=Toxorhynchites rutilus septentrionalis TaxID=329112 RepID=UPI002479025F|nr:uncharacterized protein LOC129767557 [Toxorhynchites rutilus septentrionalis]